MSELDLCPSNGGGSGARVFHSKYDLHLGPHSADAAVGEIPIEKVGGGGADHVGRNLSELRVIQGIECFPAKLQPPLLSDLEGLGQG